MRIQYLVGGVTAAVVGGWLGLHPTMSTRDVCTPDEIVSICATNEDPVACGQTIFGQCAQHPEDYSRMERTRSDHDVYLTALGGKYLDALAAIAPPQTAMQTGETK